MRAMLPGSTAYVLFSGGELALIELMVRINIAENINREQLAWREERVCILRAAAALCWRAGSPRVRSRSNGDKRRK